MAEPSSEEAVASTTADTIPGQGTGYCAAFKPRYVGTTGRVRRTGTLPPAQRRRAPAWYCTESSRPTRYVDRLQGSEGRAS